MTTRHTVAAIINPDPERGVLSYHGNLDCRHLVAGRTEGIVVTEAAARLKGYSPCPAWANYRAVSVPCWSEAGYIVGGTE